MSEWAKQLENQQHLTPEQTRDMADWLLDPHVSDEKKAISLEQLTQKGATHEEIIAFVREFLARSINPEIPDSAHTIDVVGTGGDQLGLFNVSTTSMFLTAACGATVVKHGNRGFTSKSGGADVLEALGIDITMNPERFRQCVAEAGVGFLFAPLYHPSFKAVAAARQLLAGKGMKTIFNIIGPLLNPARPRFQLSGVFQPNLMPLYTTVLRDLGRENAWVVCGHAPENRFADELSTMGLNDVNELSSRETQQASTFQLDPRTLGIARAPLADLQGGDAQENAQILQQILRGTETGAKRDIVLLNSAASLVCARLASNLAEGLVQAQAAIDSGAALDRLIRLQNASKNS